MTDYVRLELERRGFVRSPCGFAWTRGGAAMSSEALADMEEFYGRSVIDKVLLWLDRGALTVNLLVHDLTDTTISVELKPVGLLDTLAQVS